MTGNRRRYFHGVAAVLTLASAVVAASGSARLTGVLREESGRPLARTRVLACMTRVCLIGQTGPDGRFTFEIDPPADVVIKTEEDPALRRGAAMTPVRVAGPRTIDVGSVYVPKLAAGRPLVTGAAVGEPLDAGDGLLLTLSRRDLKAAPGQTILDVAARRLPSNRFPKYEALGDDVVIAVYALHPFAATSVTPIAVRAASRLPAGTRVKFRTIDEIDGTFSAPAAGVADGRYVATDPATGITRLTYLVISR